LLYNVYICSLLCYNV